MSIWPCLLSRYAMRIVHTRGRRNIFLVKIAHQSAVGISCQIKLKRKRELLPSRITLRNNIVHRLASVNAHSAGKSLRIGWACLRIVEDGSVHPDCVAVSHRLPFHYRHQFPF